MGNALNLPFYLWDQTSNVVTWSADQYSYPLAPQVSAIFGCMSDTGNNQSVSECPTPGGVWLTVFGINFININPQNTFVSSGVYAAACASLIVPNTSCFFCQLPAFTGTRLKFQVC
jgi:hypothetical protein